MYGRRRRMHLSGDVGTVNIEKTERAPALKEISSQLELQSKYHMAFSRRRHTFSRPLEDVEYCRLLVHNNHYLSPADN